VNSSVLRLFTLVSVAALLGFGALALSRRVDSASAERYGQALRTLLALDFRLSAEVLKARGGVVGHYDAIVQTQAARKRLHRLLAVPPEFFPEPVRRELRAEIASAESMRETVERLVERFKRENAVLRNSLRYMPVLSAEIDPRYAGSLVQDALLMQTWDDTGIATRIDASLATLQAALSQTADEQRGSVAALLTHARVARERTPLVNALTRQIIALSGAQRTQAITAHFEHDMRLMTRRGDRDANLVFALALVSLLLSAASIIARLRSSADAQRQTSAQLVTALGSLRQEQAKQLELSELKTRFVAMTSHEFRTPLSVIMSSGEMLEAYAERWPVGKKQEHFARIRAAALGMTRMLDAILMIGRSDAGALACDPQPLELKQFCTDVLSSVCQANDQGTRIEHRGLDAPEWVMADAVLLRQVLENLLSNALKYSPGGGRVFYEVSHDDTELLFRVRDSGIGITPEDQRLLFETFHRGKNVGNISGTGLGLAVVGRAVKLQGGKVACQSQLGLGTEFSVRIPYVRSET
jgi:signal transduction histidine kinase